MKHALKVQHKVGNYCTSDYPSFKMNEGNNVYILPYRFETVEKLVEFAARDNTLKYFLCTLLSSNECVFSLDGSIFWGSDIPKTIPTPSKDSSLSDELLKKLKEETLKEENIELTSDGYFRYVNHPEKIATQGSTLRHYLTSYNGFEFDNKGVDKMKERYESIFI